MGRPKKIDTRSNGYFLRMNKEERYKLESICKKEGMSKAEVLRKGIEILNYMSKNGGVNVYTKTHNGGVNVYTKTPDYDF